MVRVSDIIVKRLEVRYNFDPIPSTRTHPGTGSLVQAGLDGIAKESDKSMSLKQQESVVLRVYHAPANALLSY